jgi:hypothetical protein
MRFYTFYTVLLAAAISVCIAVHNLHENYIDCGLIAEEPVDKFTSGLKRHLESLPSSNRCDAGQLRDAAAVYCDGDVRTAMCGARIRNHAVACSDARGQALFFSATAPCNYTGRGADAAFAWTI